MRRDQEGGDRQNHRIYHGWINATKFFIFMLCMRDGEAFAPYCSLPHWREQSAIAVKIHTLWDMVSLTQAEAYDVTRGRGNSAGR